MKKMKQLYFLRKLSKTYFSKKPIFINDFQGINYLNIKIE